MLDTETPARRAWQRAGQDLGHPISDELFLRFVGRTAADSNALIRELWGSDFPLNKLRERITFHWLQDIAQNPIATKPGLIELLDYLDSVGLRKAIATSSHRHHALAKLGSLVDRFDALVTGDDVVRGKPAPDIFLLAANELGQLPAECLVLEDSLPGIRGAQAAGIYAIMVPDLIPPDDQVIHVAPSLLDVMAWLKSLPQHQS